MLLVDYKIHKLHPCHIFREQHQSFLRSQIHDWKVQGS